MVLRFEWDAAKRDANLAKHGIDLLRGTELFDGRPVHIYQSARGDESRWVTIGLVGSAFFALVWTQRGDTLRLIFLRRARDAERRAYHQQNG